MKKHCALLLVSWLWCCAGSGAPPHVEVTKPGDPDYLLTGATLIDGTGAAPRKAAVLLRGGKIHRIGSTEELEKASEGAEVLDLSGKYILPGLIDSHVHFGGWEGLIYLYFGITTVVDTGNLTEWILAQREAERRGRIEGPRIYATGNHLNGPMEADGSPRKADFGGWAHFVPDPTSALETCKLLERQGVDAIKIQDRLSRETLQAIVDFAAEKNLPIVGHLPVDARTAAQMGLKYIEHIIPLARAIWDPPSAKMIPFQDLDPAKFPELIQVLVKNEVNINPTLFLNFRFASRKSAAFKSEDEALLAQIEAPKYLERRWLASYEFNAITGERNDENTVRAFAVVGRLLREFSQAGGRIQSGSDAASYLPPGVSLYREMEMLVEVGVSPMEVIKSATLYPALFFRKDRELGSVEVGKYADLLILDRNPLEDIANLRSLALVLKAGRIVKRRFEVYENPIPRPASFEPVPKIVELDPPRVAQGARQPALVIKGSDFMLESVVQIAGETFPAELVDDRTLRAALPERMTAAAGVHAVTVSNPYPAAGISNEAYFIVAAPEELTRPLKSGPPPVLMTVPNPPRWRRGGGNAVLTLDGRNFSEQSVVRFGNERRVLKPTFISNQQLRVTVPADLLLRVGTFPLTVYNPPPEGGTSNTRYMFVDFDYAD